LKLSVAIPESALSDESLKIDKTRKISILARACAIFKIDTIYVYQDDGKLQTRWKSNGNDSKIFRNPTIFEKKIIS